MVTFHCGGCGHILHLKDGYAGRKGRCPKCGLIGTVPATELVASADEIRLGGRSASSRSYPLKVRCPECNQKVGVKAHSAGKRLRCPRCEVLFLVPGEPGTGSGVSLPNHASPFSQEPPASRPAVVVADGRVKFYCACGQKIGVAIARCGQSVLCPKCGAAMQVPPFPAKPAAQADEGAQSVVNLAEVQARGKRVEVPAVDPGSLSPGTGGENLLSDLAKAEKGDASPKNAQAQPPVQESASEGATQSVHPVTSPSPSSPAPPQPEESNGMYDVAPDTRPCPFCGEQVHRYAKKCRHCGEWVQGAAPIRAQPAGNQGGMRSHVGMAGAAMILSICGLVLFGFITGLLAVIFAGIALSGMRQTGDNEGRGMAIAGLVLGIIDIVGWLIGMGIWFG